MRRSTVLEGFLVSSSYEVLSYVVPFPAKTAQFCGKDSWHDSTVAVACVWIKLVGYSIAVCGGVPTSKDFSFRAHTKCQVTLFHLERKQGDFAVRIYGMLETVPIACVRMKLVG
jgi:hypothetical protein